MPTQPSDQPTQGYVLSAKESPFLSPPSKASPVEQGIPRTRKDATAGAIQQHQHQQHGQQPPPSQPSESRDPPARDKAPGFLSQLPDPGTAPSMRTDQQGGPPNLKLAATPALTNSVPTSVKATAPVKPPVNTAPSVSPSSPQSNAHGHENVHESASTESTQHKPQVPQTAHTANHSSNGCTMDRSRDTAPAEVLSPWTLQQQGHSSSSSTADRWRDTKRLSQAEPYAGGLQSAREEQLLRYVEQLKERLKASACINYIVSLYCGLAYSWQLTYWRALWACRAPRQRHRPCAVFVLLTLCALCTMVVQGSKAEAETLEQLLANAEARADERSAEIQQLQGVRARHITFCI
eukprot:1149945-Pelagomonas_calceolata.AAC.5